MSRHASTNWRYKDFRPSKHVDLSFLPGRHLHLCARGSFPFYVQLFSSGGRWKLFGSTFVHFWNQNMPTTCSWIFDCLQCRWYCNFTGPFLFWDCPVTSQRCNLTSLSFMMPFLLIGFDFKLTWHSASCFLFVNVYTLLRWRIELTPSPQCTCSQASLLMSRLWIPSRTAWSIIKNCLYPCAATIRLICCLQLVPWNLEYWSNFVFPIGFDLTTTHCRRLYFTSLIIRYIRHVKTSPFISIPCTPFMATLRNLIFWQKLDTLWTLERLQ